MQISEAQVKQILKTLHNLEYGSVLITVHQSKIVQIDRTEKQRFPSSIHANTVPLHKSKSN